jgi:hypothetical protein
LNPICPSYVFTTHSAEYRGQLPQAQHKHFNTRLNELKIASAQPGFPSTPIAYTHLHLVDSFYPTDNPHDKEKIRVTRDEKTGNVIECMRKIRLGDLNIYSPKRAADWRVSVNLEVPGSCITCHVFFTVFIRSV